MTRARAIAGLALLLLVQGPSAARAGAGGPPNWVVPGGQEARILSLVAPNETMAPVLPGTWFDRIEITDDAIIFVVSGREPPAGPLSIWLKWDAYAPSDRAPPPWRLEVRGEAEAGPLTESVALLRGRIEARLTPEVYNGLLSYVADSGGDLAVEAPDWVERIAGTFGLVWRERSERGLVQYSLRDVEVTAPAMPSAWILLSLLALVLAGGGLGLRRIRRSPRPAEAATWWPVLAGATGGMGVLAAWWLHAPMSEAGIIVADYPSAVLDWMVPAHRESAVARVFLLAASLAAGFGLVDIARSGPGAGRLRLALDAAIVTGVSLLVRGVLTAPNLYSQGAGGFERMLRYVPGEGGVSLMISGVLPGSEAGFIWSAVGAATLLSASGPPLIYLLGRALGFSSPVSLVAGVALACWPLHAMLSASDLLAGPVIAVGIGAWAFCAQAAAKDRPRLLLPAAALLAWGVWCRLDGYVLLLPAIAILAPALGRWRRRPELWGPGAWIGLAISCRLLSWPGGTGHEGWTGGEALAALAPVGHAILPWWLLLSVPGVIAAYRSPQRLPLLFGAVAAAVAAPILWTVDGPSVWIEAGALLMPWVVLLCGLGVEALGSRLSGRTLRAGLVAVYAIGVLVTPALHRPALLTERQPARTDRAFRAGLPLVPTHCGILVTAGEAQVPAPELRRVRLIAWEEFERDPDRPRGEQVVSGASSVVKPFACCSGFDAGVGGWYEVNINRYQGICR